MPLVTEELLVPTVDDVQLPEPPLYVPQSRPRRSGFSQWLHRWAGAGLNSMLGPRETQAFGILAYHRIADAVPDYPPPTWNVTPERFEAQLRGLLARGWQAWPLRQVLQCIARELPIPRKAFVVTFDDGFANVLTRALPVLTSLRVPATVFLATAYLDSKQPFPSDDWAAAGLPGVPGEAWRPLSTEECRRLAANGLVELGAHSHTLADFRGQPAALARDLAQNLAVLREQFDMSEPLFAWPCDVSGAVAASGEWNNVLRAAGLSCGLRAGNDLVRPGDDPFAWRRFVVEPHDTAATLAGKLGGWHAGLALVCPSVSEANAVSLSYGSFIS